jgi:hypothetical protein
MHSFIFSVRLGMIRMRPHIGHPSRLDELRPFVSNELRSSVVNDLGLTKPALASLQGVDGALFGTHNVLGRGGNQHFAMDQIATVGIQNIEQPIPLRIEIPHHQVGMPTLIRVIRFRRAAEQFGSWLASTQQVRFRQNGMHHPGIQKSLFFQHQTVGQPFVPETPMDLGKLADALLFGRRRRKGWSIRDDDVVGEPVLLSTLGPTLIGDFRQFQVGKNRVETFVRTPLLNLSNDREDSRLLLGGVTAIRRNYQRPFFRRRLSLEISAMTSRRRWISLSSASSLGRSFLRPRG